MVDAMTVDDHLVAELEGVVEVGVGEVATHAMPADLVGAAVQEDDLDAVRRRVRVPDDTGAALRDEVEAELGRGHEEDRVVLGDGEVVQENGYAQFDNVGVDHLAGAGVGAVPGDDGTGRGEEEVAAKKSISPVFRSIL
jgi:hypothetical protein